jgi:NADH-quinone oxidoreductase subunit E
MLQANLEFYRNVDTPEKVDALLNELRQRASSGEALSVSGRFAER